MKQLTTVEARILGALLEKEATTPEYYPLTVNALVAACNQKSNRFPMVEYDEDTVIEALDDLRREDLIESVPGSRVTRYEQRLTQRLNLGRRETALMCTLLLRGPQTLGVWRARSDRMHGFADLAEVENVLQRMAERQPPLVTRMARTTGMKESRYAHLLSGEPEAMPAPASVPASSSSELQELREEVAALREEVAKLQQQMQQLLKTQL